MAGLADLKRLKKEIDAAAALAQAKLEAERAAAALAAKRKAAAQNLFKAAVGKVQLLAPTGLADIKPEPPAPTPLEATPIPSPVQPVGKAPLIRDSDLPSRQPPADAAMPGGALLQIVSDRLESSGQGSKKLQVTIKGDKRQQIQVSEVKVQVYFYDEENGEIVPSKAQVTSSWLSLPVDWKKEIPELLEVNYLPDSVDENIRFAGYLVAIYYKGDLQDCRANPPRLKKLFEPKYFIGNDEP